MELRRDNMNEVFKRHFRVIKESDEKRIDLDIQQMIIKHIANAVKWGEIANEVMYENGDSEEGNNEVQRQEEGVINLETGFNVQRELSFVVNVTVMFKVIQNGRGGYDHDYPASYATETVAEGIRLDLLTVVDNTDGKEIHIEPHLLEGLEKHINGQ